MEINIKSHYMANEKRRTAVRRFFAEIFLSNKQWRREKPDHFVLTNGIKDFRIIEKL